MQNVCEDIEEKIDFRLANKTAFPHYLGAVIVAGGKPTSGNEVSRMLVIDGQQRLTTMQLFICALRDIARLQGWTALDLNLTWHIEN